MSNPQKKTSTELIPVSTAASSTRTAIMTALGKLVEQAIDEGVQERLDQAITLLKGSQSVTPLNGEIISPAPRKRAPRTSESMSRNAAQDHSISVRDAILELLNSKPKAMIPRVDVLAFVKKRRGGLALSDTYYYKLCKDLEDEGIIERESGAIKLSA